MVSPLNALSSHRVCCRPGNAQNLVYNVPQPVAWAPRRLRSTGRYLPFYGACTVPSPTASLGVLCDELGMSAQARLHGPLSKWNEDAFFLHHLNCGDRHLNSTGRAREADLTALSDLASG